MEREIEDLLKNLSRSTFIQNSLNNENDRLPHSNKGLSNLNKIKLKELLYQPQTKFYVVIHTLLEILN